MVAWWVSRSPRVPPDTDAREPDNECEIHAKHHPTEHSGDLAGLSLVFRSAHSAQQRPRISQ